MCKKNCKGLDLCCGQTERVELAELDGHYSTDDSNVKGRWTTNGRRLAMASAVVTGSLGMLSALPSAAQEDPSNERGMRFDDHNDDDGMCWEDFEACQSGPDGRTPPLAQSDSTPGPCVDSDGDGWGWDGAESCRMFVDQPTQEPTVVEVPGPNDLSNQLRDDWERMPTPTSIDLYDQEGNITTRDNVLIFGHDDPRGQGGTWVTSGGHGTYIVDAPEALPVEAPTELAAPEASSLPAWFDDYDKQGNVVEAGCVDVGPLNDGWGWDGSESCRVAPEVAMSSLGINDIIWIDGQPTCQPHMTRDFSVCDNKLAALSGNPAISRLAPGPSAMDSVSDPVAQILAEFMNTGSGVAD